MPVRLRLLLLEEILEMIRMVRKPVGSRSPDKGYRFDSCHFRLLETIRADEELVSKTSAGYSVLGANPSVSA